MSLTLQSRVGTLAVAGALTGPALVGLVPTAVRATSPREAMAFAADMAKRGSWREARYRWESVSRQKPDDPRILNNLAVAAEALGEPDEAREHYRRALTLSRGDDRIEDNQIRFERFWSHLSPTDDQAPTSDEAPLLAAPPAGSGSGAKGKTLKVTVALPVPPRLDTSGYQTLLVASFLGNDSALIDVNREWVRFVRSKLRKDPELELLDVAPAPAVPEQRLEDLVANAEFWKYLGREYGADLIVSGLVGYGRRDQSGFQDVDVVNPATGQKVRQSEFVEQERFSYTVDLLFFSGSTGEPVYQDRLQRSQIYRGSNNDPITAFHDLSESLTSDLMAIVEPRTREDVRVIFRK